MILVDSSVWIDFWNSGKGAFAERLFVLLDDDKVAVNGFIYGELLKGARTVADRRFIRDSLDAVTWLEFTDADFRSSEEFRWTLKQKGVNLTLIDGFIAHHAVRTGSQLFSKDKVFQKAAEHSSLKLVL